MEKTSESNFLWRRYVEDLAIRRFHALGSDAERQVGEEDSYLYVVDLFWNLPSTDDKERRFVQLHVLAYLRYHQLVQQVMLLRPFQMMSSFVCNKELVEIRKRVRLDSFSLEEHSYAGTVSTKGSTISSSGERFSIHFFCGVILPHLNKKLPDISKDELLSKYYKELTRVVRSRKVTDFRP